MEKRNAIWVFFGLIATGKSTVAAKWAAMKGLSHYNSDIIRKNLAGIPSTSKREEAHNQGIYSWEFTSKTYDALLEQAEKESVSGKGVVLDASYQERRERDRIRHLARSLDVRIVFVYCICSPDVVKKRLEARGKDPGAVSDGRWDIYQIQTERFEPPDELNDDLLVVLPTDKPVEELLEHLERSLE